LEDVMNTISKTEAIRLASNAVAAPVGYGSFWSVSGPYDGIKSLHGQQTARETDCYWKAKQIRARWVASLALQLLGWNWSDADGAAERHIGSVRERVNQAISS
jgi:hypothetical protein